MMNPAFEALEKYLKARSMNGIALAFSGGVDSSLLLAVLKRIQANSPFPLLALTMHSVFQKEEELEDVRRAALRTGVELHVFDCDPISIPEVENNPTDRCYWCKRAIFSEIVKYANSRGIKTVLDGTNADDLHIYRPGRKALRELGIISPLAELGITKRQIRETAVELGLECASKPAAPCLATRFEYGTHLTGEAVRRAAAGEAFLYGLFPEAETLRLRIHGKIARIEVPDSLIPAFASRRRELVSGLKKLGYPYITLDLEGFRSGSMDLDVDL